MTRRRMGYARDEVEQRPPRNTDLGPLFETPSATPFVPIDTSQAAAEAIKPSAAAIRSRVADLVTVVVIYVKWRRRW